MALKLDMSISAYSKLERGQTDPTLSRVEKIAEILNFKLNDYYLWKTQGGQTSLINNPDENSNLRYVTRREYSELQRQFEALNERLYVLEKNS